MLVGYLTDDVTSFEICFAEGEPYAYFHNRKLEIKYLIEIKDWKRYRLADFAPGSRLIITKLDGTKASYAGSFLTREEPADFFTRHLH